METVRLKVRIGQHEFEGEGPQEVIEKQFDAFRQMVSDTAAIAPVSNQPETTENKGAAEPGLPSVEHPSAQQARKIIHVDGELLTLGVLPKGDNQESEAALLLLLGHKLLRSSNLVSADDLLNGLNRN